MPFREAGGWPLPEDLSEEDLDKKLCPPGASEPSAKPLPDFDYIYRELKAHKKFNLTLDLLWREYKEQYPEGYQYTQFSVLYRRWQKKLDYSMARTTEAGRTVRRLRRRPESDRCPKQREYLGSEYLGSRLVF